MADTILTNNFRVHDGLNERCKLDGASVTMEFSGGGAATLTFTTDENGAPPSTPYSVAVRYTDVKVTITKTGYRSQAFNVKVLWAGATVPAVLKINAAYMIKK